MPAATSRKAVAALQMAGAPHVYLEFPGKDHEFWIRRGAAQMEKVFLFFSLVSRKTTVPLKPYSSRSATSGSIRDARRAGIHAASVPAAARTPTAIAVLATSPGCTP